MIIKCNHGYFFIYEDEPGEVATFNSYYGQDLVSVENYFTFEALSELNKYAIKGKTYGGAVVTKTYEGEPYKIMKENNLVYDFINKIMLNKLLSGSLVEPQKAYNFYFMNGLIVPGSFTKTEPRKILSYTCRVNLKELIFRYSELKYV